MAPARNQAGDPVRELPAHLTGEAVPLSTANHTLLTCRLNALLDNKLRDSILGLLPVEFHADASDFRRCVHFVCAAAEILSKHRDASLDSLTTKMIQRDALICGLTTPDIAPTTRGVLFAVVGWLTMLYKTAIDDYSTDSLTVDSRESSQLAVSSLSSFYATRSTVEILRNLGETLPVPRSSTQYTALKIASMNAATLRKVGGIQIKWIETVAGHLEFDPVDDGGTIKLFRSPSLLALQETKGSILSSILEGYYDDTRDPHRKFSVAKMSREVKLSYSLFFRYDRRAQKIYSSQERDKAGVNGSLDPMLDQLCLGPAGHRRSPVHHTPGKESFDAASDFPIFASRLIHIQQHIDGVQPTTMSSLWRDKRDILRWYTFWAVIILGSVNLIIACFQAAMAAAQVALAREAINAQLVRIPPVTK